MIIQIYFLSIKLCNCRIRHVPLITLSLVICVQGCHMSVDSQKSADLKANLILPVNCPNSLRKYFGLVCVRSNILIFDFFKCSSTKKFWTPGRHDTCLYIEADANSTIVFTDVKSHISSTTFRCPHILAYVQCMAYASQVNTWSHSVKQMVIFMHTSLSSTIILLPLVVLNGYCICEEFTPNLI